MKPELIVQLPPLRPDGQRELQAQARQGDMLAAIILRPYWLESSTYVLEQYWDRANRAIRRKLTPGQDERGRVLAGLLRERLNAALEAEGWQDAGVNYEGRPLWRYAGPVQREAPAPPAGTAAKPPASRASVPPARPVETTAPAVPAQPLPAASKRIAVPRGKQPRTAYSRTLTTRQVTFTCQQCGKTVSQQRFPGPSPRYCGDTCKQEATRVGTRARVQRFRESKQGVR